MRRLHKKFYDFETSLHMPVIYSLMVSYAIYLTSRYKILTVRVSRFRFRWQFVIKFGLRQAIKIEYFNVSFQLIRFRKFKKKNTINPKYDFRNVDTNMFFRVEILVGCEHIKKHFFLMP